MDGFLNINPYRLLHSFTKLCQGKQTLYRINRTNGTQKFSTFVSISRLTLGLTNGNVFLTYTHNITPNSSGPTTTMSEKYEAGIEKPDENDKSIIY